MVKYADILFPRKRFDTTKLINEKEIFEKYCQDLLRKNSLAKILVRYFQTKINNS